MYSMTSIINATDLYTWKWLKSWILCYISLTIIKNNFYVEFPRAHNGNKSSCNHLQGLASWPRHWLSDAIINLSHPWMCWASHTGLHAAPWMWTHQLHYLRRACPLAGPSAWNMLPLDACVTHLSSPFKCLLKYCLLSESFLSRSLENSHRHHSYSIFLHGKSHQQTHQIFTCFFVSSY